MGTARRILIVRLSAIGDCLLSTAFSSALKDTWPEAELNWVAHSHCAPILEGNRDLAAVFSLDRKAFWKGLPRLLKTLRRSQWDSAVDLQGLLKSAVIARFSGARECVGRAEAREGAGMLYCRVLPAASDVPVLVGYSQLAISFGANEGLPITMRLPITDAHRAAANTLLMEKGIGEDFAVLNPGAGKLEKQWPPERYAAVADWLAARKMPVAITGSPAETALAEQISLLSQSKPANLAGSTSLLELGAVLERSKLFVGGDTGPMHMAQAAGTRVVALFGPSDASKFGPVGEQHRTLVAPDKTMATISVGEVSAAITAMLG